ncbi:MAG TPA: hypothetical protein VMT37_01305 [Solirubrobacterales bacterium]|nr:hypothetical protein [Solirubrobacterales bacterium]
MSEDRPIACSLSAGELSQRLEEIAAVGASSLIDQREEGGRQLLRFRGDAETHRRLRAIVAAEAECCPFLELALETQGGELVLTVAAGAAGREAAEALAHAFLSRR